VDDRSLVTLRIIHNQCVRRSLKTVLFGLVFPLTITSTIIACGGGGGSSTANTCKLAPLQNPAKEPGVIVPTSSLHVRGLAHKNHLILDTSGRATTFLGYTPDQIRTAYGIPDNGGSNVITVIEAFDNPTALQDFNAFSSAFGLPVETSTDITNPANQHLQVVYAHGKPGYNADWSQESALDIEWVHGTAPNAKIVVIEATSDKPADLMNADDLAASVSNAHQCSNSWSSPETTSETLQDQHFNHPGVVYFFASGDTGGVRDYPPASPNVVAVGGTSLTLDGLNNRVQETVWSGTGCGASDCESRPAYQDGIQDIVGSSRGLVDVAAVADPKTGLRVRWRSQWVVFGGTSAACPIIAGIANVAGTNRSSAQEENAFMYSQLGTSSFFDVTTGQAGQLRAAVGWDFPTGVGTPNGTSGF